jgi:PAS domain S-box-containing protein
LLAKSQQIRFNLVVFWKSKRKTATKPKLPRGSDLYFHAFQQASIPTLICDPLGAILEVNQSFTALLGYTNEELAGRRVSEITHSSDLEGHHGRMTQLISGAQDNLRVEKRYVRKDGSTVWGSISVSVAKNADGRAAFMISQIRDITTERRTREKLLESEGRLQAILDNSEAIIYGKDLNGRYILVNRQFEAIFGLSRERIIGCDDAEIFPAPQAEAFERNDRLVIQAGKGMQFEEEAPVGDELRTYVSVKFPLRNIRGQMVAVCGISTDITERKFQERELKLLNEKLWRTNDELKEIQLHLIQAEKLESVGRLAAGVAHEVKNPLALLSLGVDYLEGTAVTDDPNVPSILTDMREAVTRAEKIIHGMVDFSSDRQLKIQRHDLNEIVQGAETLVRHELTRNSIEVINSLGEDLPDVAVDRVKIEQVLVNLLMNSIQAMQPMGAGRLVISTFVQRLAVQEWDAGARTADHLRGGDEVVVVRIVDSGPGIPAAIQPKIFDPFFTTKATGEGTGLGLSVVKKIVDLHRGLLHVENNPDQGVTITLTLRAQSAPLPVTPKTSPIPLP